MKLWAPKSVVRVAIENAGLRKSYVAVSFLIEWSIAMRKLGDEMNVDQFAEWWAVSRSQAFRRQADFRIAFPGWSPTDLVKALGLNVKNAEEGFLVLLDRPMAVAS
jgi:hypothetical protein